ncbi:MAG: signal peptidase I [Candidatus Nanoarchaeia archaeon]|nr:signal peptidase I [Candidatus Haiyanarchaeum thermophilum]MCW1303166.1 signal peptidase I [Candidatus Haiyanarchaeum thermophilum]MCW1303831.1 signal peptidase I [Candidatus Haiyanarchaeum thermophilum]MCW1306552.1 signal peptidase I [Candidatus Haiyanarchaeum thermophilum]MCW1306966.1 signal peptidase I [Candidatus Haiyanarchaeum thermophilum]
MKWRENLRKLWKLIFLEESWKGYLAFLLFLLILFYFLFNFLLPHAFQIVDIVAIVSESMEHKNVDDTFYKFFLQRNFTLEEIRKFDFSDGINRGDVVLVKKIRPEELKVGDVIVFNSPNGKIIHRVISIENGSVTTKGDANPSPLGFEQHISAQQIIGKAYLRIPYLGYPRILLLMLLGV